MKVVLFGASGMVGQGVLRECLLDTDVDAVLSIGRSGTGQHHEKLRELVHPQAGADFTDFGPIAGALEGYDACFFCLGVSSAGMTEADYRRVSFDFTLAAGRALAAANPDTLTFVYVSGAGTDSTEQGRTMWARVKGATENALMKLPFKGAYMFRPGIIQPLHGIKSKTRLYRAGYVLMAPFFPIVKALARGSMLTTEQVGRAMLAVAKRGADKPLLEARDIAALAPA